MDLFLTVLAAGFTFGLCYIVDKRFTHSFRSKAQHKSGLAVRVNKHYGGFGVGLSVLGVLSVCVGFANNIALLIGGIVGLAMGISLAVYFLTHGIFYDGESFLVASFRKADRIYPYDQIVEQKLYMIQGGSVVIELHMTDGTAVSLQSSMEGVYLFLDTAFAGWCLQKGSDPQSCDFHDPSKSWWFPHEEDV